MRLLPLRLLVLSGLCIAVATGMFVLFGQDAKEKLAVFSLGPARATNCESSLTKKKQCWEEEILHILDSEGVGPALSRIAQLYEADANFRQDCHSYTHLVGEKAYELFSQHRDVNVSPLVYYCNFGFYHGFMESLMQATGNAFGARDFCAYIGQSLRNSVPAAESGCYHGIGHGFLDGSDPRVTGDVMAIMMPVIKLCERISPSDELRYACASGIFDGLDNLMIEKWQGLSVDPNDPFRVCTIQQKEYLQEACYRIFVAVPMWFTHDNFSEAVHAIERIVDNTHANVAAKSIAQYYVQTHRNMEDSFPVMIQRCHELQERLRLSCISGIGVGLAENGQPGKEEEAALHFCADPGLTKEEHATCLQDVAHYFTLIFSRERVETLCANFSGEDRSRCQ